MTILLCRGIARIETHARQLGYNVMLCNSQQDAKTTEELFGFLTSHQVDGIILANSHSNAPRWIQQFAPHLPTVLLGTPASLSGDEVNSVCIDNLAGGRLRRNTCCRSDTGASPISATVPAV